MLVLGEKIFFDTNKTHFFPILQTHFHESAGNRFVVKSGVTWKNEKKQWL